jgi:hypothetical protein
MPDYHDNQEQFDGINLEDYYYPSYPIGYNLRDYLYIPLDPANYNYVHSLPYYTDNSYIYDYRPLFYPF